MLEKINSVEGALPISPKFDILIDFSKQTKIRTQMKHWQKL